MQVLTLVVFAVASVSGLGSGPYLPSGWKPQGPAFHLPSEVQKPAENPLKDTLLQESEASGSDALREYGPPKAEVSQDLTSQGLPDAVTEQAFVVIDANISEEVNGEVREFSEVSAVQEVAVDAAVKAEVVTETVVDSSEVTGEQKATEEAVTESIEYNTTTSFESEAIQGRAINVADEETAEIQEVTTESVETTTDVESTEAVSVESTAAVSAEPKEAAVDSNVESTQVQQDSQVQEVSQVEAQVGRQEVAQLRTAEEGVKNVAEALVNLENEIKDQQIQANEEAVEVKSVQVLGSVEQTPEGFLEYGPPGFREYGPPQADELLKTGALVQEPTEEEQKIENNETRRRRYSPKFKASKKQH